MELQDASVKLLEGIRLVLSEWPSLQFAVQNEFGGPDSLHKYQQLPHDLFFWLTHSTGTIYDLENMLDDFMLSLNTQLDDGSIEEVSEKLMLLHEECFGLSVPEDANDGGPVDANDGGPVKEHAEKGALAPECEPNGTQKDMMMVDKPLFENTTEAEEGWTVVSRTRSKTKRN
ncbi:uncharacterized protein LOC141713307 isoform X1 [Apium graveolens]|uniref:uncharacterized protein LOC141713307 isoform X1 n=1 Tax=Apium graveolens TaxID=4045 RepID=UPI003D79CD1C